MKNLRLVPDCNDSSYGHEVWRNGPLVWEELKQLRLQALTSDFESATTGYQKLIYLLIQDDPFETVLLKTASSVETHRVFEAFTSKLYKTYGNMESDPAQNGTPPSVDTVLFIGNDLLENFPIFLV